MSPSQAGPPSRYFYDNSFLLAMGVVGALLGTVGAVAVCAVLSSRSSRKESRLPPRTHSARAGKARATATRTRKGKGPAVPEAQIERASLMPAFDL